MIRFVNVSKKYSDDTTAVNSLDLEIEDGEFFVIIGPSGCGKTTTLKMINRLIESSDGTVWINNRKVSDYNIYELRWDIGYVLQEIALFPHMTIEENIAIVPELKNWDKKRIHRRVIELLEMAGLDPKTYRNRKPAELSGGEQQRIGVIRALASDPKIILMDEPFSALDPISREKLQDELLDLQKRIKKTIVFVTHDMNEALKLGDRVCIMKDGVIVQVGAPADLLNHPKNDFVREFVGNKEIGLYNDVVLEEIMLAPLEKATTIPPTQTIPVTAALKEVIAALTATDQLGVEKDGMIVGMINRQIVFSFLANRIQEGGRS